MPGLHPAEIFLEAGCPEKAMTSAQQSIALQGEDPLLRQIMSFVCFRRNDNDLGFRYLAYALYNNPLCCRKQFLGNETVLALLDTLESSSENEAAACLELPFALWKEHLLPVACKDQDYYAHIKTLAEKNGETVSCNDNLTGLCFIRALYCAEVLRLSKSNHETMVALRSRMKTFHPLWLSEYMLVFS